MRNLILAVILTQCLWAQQDGAAAVAALQKTVAVEPDNGQAWFGLGAALHRLGREEESGRAFERAAALKFQAPQALAAVARAYAYQGNAQQTAVWLNRAADAGFPNVRFLDGDPGFAKVKDDAGYQKARVRIDLNAHPCMARPEYRQFDFWLGEWEVQVSGKTIAHSRIERILDGCLLQENWMPFGGTEGKSWNYYEASTGQWEQLWMSGGNLLKLHGGLKDGAMVLEGPGQVLSRITWTPLGDGGVRQVWTQSSDGGKTWASQFDGLYVPKKK